MKLFQRGKNDAPKPPKVQAKTFHEQLERLNPLLGTVLSIALGIKSSYLWSFGSLDITKLPGVLPSILNISSAIAIAITAETLSINSGSHAWRALQRSIDIGTERGINKTQRAAMKAKLRSETFLHGSFGIIGAGASTAAMVYFAISHSGQGSNEIGDLVTAIMVQVLVLYIGVFFEPSAPNPFAVFNAEASRGVAAIMSTYAENIRKGTYDNNMIVMMQQAMPKEMRSMLDGLKKHDGTIKLWNTTEIVTFLLSRLTPAQRDIMYNTTMRDVRNWLNDNSDNAFFEIRDAEKGSGKVIPGHKMFLLFEEPIKRAVEGQPAFIHGRKRPTHAPAPNQERKITPAEKENTGSLPESTDTIPENIIVTEAIIPAA